MKAQTPTASPQQKLGLVNRVYVWSVVFESLLFFIIGSQFATGFNITVGKVLQILVIILLILGRIAYRRDIRIVNPKSPAYKYFAAFFALAIVSGIIGAFSGRYTLNAGYGSAYASTAIARFIRGAGTRPFIEYAILAYYFVYFTVLPRYLLRSDKGQAYFFRVFRIAFTACLAFGFVDLLLQAFGHSGIPRDMSEGLYVGFRFHGLAGEPRDAFVYLMFGLAILNLYAYWRKRGTVSRTWIAVVFLAAILTQSASGMLGLLFAALLVIGASRKELSVKHVLWLGGTTMMILAVVLISVQSSPRLQTYVAASSVLLDALERGMAPPAAIAPQMVNIYPVWDLYTKVSHGTVGPLFIGSGLGSASVVNNNLGGSLNELANPNSEVIRLLYECGIVGTLLLVLAFIYPVRVVTSSLGAKARRRFLIFTCLLIGLFLAHRSTTPFIYLGIFLVVMGRAAPAAASVQASSLRRNGG
ncbi:MAG: hypothetical protein M3P26_00725 [Gemmatimonadota bacterium]|nr:hypothetical protein [Gemmatimonadota bacterium]